VDALAVSAEVGLAVSGSRDRTIKLWDLASGQMLGTLEGHAGEKPHEGWIEAVALESDGNHLVSIARDKTIRTWDIEDRREVYVTSGDWEDGASLALSENGQVAISGPKYGGKPLAVWRPGRRRKLRVIREIIDGSAATAVSPDGQLAVVACYNGKIHVVDLQTFSVRRTMDSPNSSEEKSEYITSVTIAHSNDIAVMGCRRGPVEVWDLKEGILLNSLALHNELVADVSLSADGSLACSTSWDYTLRLWSVPDGEVLVTFYGDEFWSSCALVGDGRKVIAGDEGGDVHALQVEGM
jgi:WD40 repeat protein